MRAWILILFQWNKTDNGMKNRIYLDRTPMTMWKYAICALVLGVWTPLSWAVELQWDRNIESDMQDYRVYACQTQGCTVMQVAANIVATVPQPTAGIVPKWTVPATMTVGTFAVSARDLSNNESGLSVQLPFDLAAPTAPAKLRLIP